MGGSTWNADMRFALTNIFVSRNVWEKWRSVVIDDIYAINKKVCFISITWGYCLCILYIVCGGGEVGSLP